MSYDVNLDVKFDPLTPIDLDAEAAAVASTGTSTTSRTSSSWHRTRAPERTVILMVEPGGVVPTGDDE